MNEQDNPNRKRKYIIIWKYPEGTITNRTEVWAYDTLWAEYEFKSNKVNSRAVILSTSEEQPTE